MENNTDKNTGQSIIKMFETYVHEKGYPDESSISSLPTVVLVGYFLKVHSKNPQMAVSRHLQSHSISYQKSNEVKMMLKALQAG